MMKVRGGAAADCCLSDQRRKSDRHERVLGKLLWIREMSAVDIRSSLIEPISGTACLWTQIRCFRTQLQLGFSLFPKVAFGKLAKRFRLALLPAHRDPVTS
jgi:hypothetical protein